jgi:hypothetical protein
VTQKEAFELFVKEIERLEIPYMICRSVAAMAYGEPRLTKDMDVVVAMPPNKVPAFHEAFTQSGFYCPPIEVILEELQRRGQFNLLHLDADTKIDCMFLGADEYSVEEFRRRERVALTEEVEASMARPEDVIIKKLEFFKMGGSEKHLSDIRSMIHVSADEMDLQYIASWVKELGLENEWRKAKPS